MTYPPSTSHADDIPSPIIVRWRSKEKKSLKRLVAEGSGNKLKATIKSTIFNPFPAIK